MNEFIPTLPNETEATLLAKELKKDKEQNGPFEAILNAEVALLTQPQAREALQAFQGEPVLLGEEAFSFNGVDYVLRGVAFDKNGDFVVRLSIYDEQNKEYSTSTKNAHPDLQLQNNEVAFRQYIFFENKSIAYMESGVAAADNAPKGFAKSLMLSTSLVARLLMDHLNIDKLEAQISDASLTKTGQVGWSKQMAERLGYVQSNDFQEMLVHTYQR